MHTHKLELADLCDYAGAPKITSLAFRYSLFGVKFLVFSILVTFLISTTFRSNIHNKVIYYFH